MRSFQLSKYFELFIKNFTPDQFELSLFSGSGTLTNLGVCEFVARALCVRVCVRCACASLLFAQDFGAVFFVCVCDGVQLVYCVLCACFY